MLTFELFPLLVTLLSLAVDDRHVVVAGPANPFDAAGISGTFRGSASAAIETSVQISVVPPEDVA